MQRVPFGLRDKPLLQHLSRPRNIYSLNIHETFSNILHCKKIFSKEAMKPSQLAKHFQSIVANILKIINMLVFSRMTD